jgi:hypothetical protein
MQLAIHALMLATIAAAVMVGKSLVVPADPAPVQEPEPAAIVSTPTPAYATVAKPFGASVRVAPSWEAAGLYNAACGMTMPVASAEGGWVKIHTEGKVGWVAASRVVLGDGPAPVDCADQHRLFASAEASTFSPNGCLSLRSRPSPEAAELACVGNGHVYAMVDGPFDPGAGGDWFRVSSPTTGTGWVPADHLHPR